MTAEAGATRFRIANEPDATRAVVAATRIGRDAGLDEVGAQAVSTAVSELVRNILKYAGSGEVLFRETSYGGSRGLIVTARDRGPGIADIEAALKDHFSSSGTLGLGLPGVRRMMDEFHIESEPGKHTTVSCLKWDNPPRGASSRQFLKHAEAGSESCDADSGDKTMPLEHSFFGRPCAGQHVSGDLAVVESRDNQLMLAVVDGLGHGPEAHRVSSRIRDYLVSHWSEDVVGTMRKLHEYLRGSIGAVAGLAVIDTHSGQVRYTGIGNTAYRVFGSRNLRMVSTAGSLGHQIRSPKVQTHILTEGDVIVMYSDGIKDRFDLEDYPQLRYQNADTIARNIVDRFSKSHDDAICLVLRNTL
jgi:anti-sigma regulatory factor (Ser/Thr protein kinase)/serine/threonine protein phosphatase PrpC